MESESAPILLLAMPQMLDPNFMKTVILLCGYTSAGAFGLVVNRQVEQPARTLVRTEPPVKVDPNVRLWIGGPVEPQRAWVLTRDRERAALTQHEVSPGVFLSVSQELTLQVLQSPPSDDTRLLIGYAGWAPAQLDQELAASAWLTLPVDPSLIFDVPPDEMWETAIRRLGADPAGLQTSSGVH